MYLALTALEEFWDTSQKIAFLGDWCKLYHRRSFWRSLEHEDLPLYWKDTDVIYKSIKYCDNIYERALNRLTIIFNEYFDLDKDQQYYRITFGVWLYHFIHYVYDKYVTLKNAFAIYPGLETWMLDEKCFHISLDSFGNAMDMQSDLYALQIYSQVLAGLGYDFPKKISGKPMKQSYTYVRQMSWKVKVRGILSSAAIKFSDLFNDKKVYITPESMPRTGDYWWIYLRSRLRCCPFSIDRDCSFTFSKNMNLRESGLGLQNDEFERILSAIIFPNFPFLYLEGFKDIRSVACSIPLGRVEALFTVQHLSHNDLYKFFIAEHFAKMKVLDMQHGGGYGIDSICGYEEYEKSVCYRFYTAGWKENRKTVPLSNIKFIPFIKTERPNLGSGKILFVTNISSRYSHRIHFYPMGSGGIKHNINDIEKFLKCLQYLDKVSLRFIQQNAYGWETENRLKDSFPECALSDLKEPFIKELNGSALFVSNVFSTTNLESMAMNRPTITFINRNVQSFRPSAQKYIQRLEDMNMVFYSPEDAAQFVNKIYPDINEWWSRSDVQSARKEFVDKFAFAQQDWRNEWLNELLGVIG
jgi:putative transferase (TIGR04331 family)